MTAAELIDALTAKTPEPKTPVRVSVSLGDHYMEGDVRSVELIGACELGCHLVIRAGEEEK